ELKALVPHGLLSATDPIWQENTDRKTARRAETVIVFPRPKSTGGVPNWLADVDAQAVKSRPTTPVPAPPQSKPKAEPPKPAAPAAALDWLDDVRQVETPAARPMASIAPPIRPTTPPARP